MGVTRQFERIRGSYGSKLALSLLVVIAVAVGIGGMVYLQTNAQLEDDVRSDLTATADARAAELDAWLNNVRGQTRLASSRPVLASGDGDAVSTFLGDLAASDSLPRGVVAVHYYDASEGRILRSSSDRMVGVSPAEQGAPFATDPPSFENASDVAVTAPFEVSIAEFPVVAVLSPVEGTADKRLVYMVNVNALTEDFSGTDGGDTAVVNAAGTTVAHTNASQTLSAYDGPAAFLDRALSGTAYEKHGDAVTAGASVSGANWAVLVRAPTGQAFALGDYVASSIVGLILLTVVSLALVGVTLGSTTVVSLRQLSARTDEMAAGDLDTDIETARTDEFGTLVDSVRRMRDSLAESLADAEAATAEAEAAREEAQRTAEALETAATEYDEAMSAVAAGDLTRRVDADRDHESMARVGRSLNEMLDDIEESVAAASAFADHVAEAATRVDDGAGDAMSAGRDVSGAVEEIADGATEQTERLQEVASEVDDLSASAEEITGTVASLAETAGQAADAVEDGQTAAGEAVDTMDAVAADAEAAADAMDALDDEMEDIGEVVDVIADIAEQTNLLAVNASIEAAHADADGDGFAVVADEVKSLAEESRTAAGDVEERLLDLQERVSEVADEMRETNRQVADGRATVDETASALDDVAEFVAETDAAAGEIRSATDQQAEAANRVASAVDEVAGISEETASQSERVVTAADEQTATLSSVEDAAADLADRAATLDDLLADFDARDDGGVSR
ncbi:MAG: methyl-accepting chemotaxis protein [Halobacteriaceae archaeon]